MSQITHLIPSKQRIYNIIKLRNKGKGITRQAIQTELNHKRWNHRITLSSVSGYLSELKKEKKIFSYSVETKKKQTYYKLTICSCGTNMIWDADNDWNCPNCFYDLDMMNILHQAGIE